jgi:hypothetical protein
MIAGLTAATALAPMPAFAAGRCANLNDTIRQCTVGLELSVPIAQQRCNSWCWAACIEAVFATNNLIVPQEAVVATLFGTDPDTNCQGADEQMIVAAISGTWTDARGQEFRASAEILPLGWMGVRTPDQTTIGADMTDPEAMALAMAQDLFSAQDQRTMLSELENGNPLIVGSVNGEIAHAVMLTAVTFLEHTSGNIALTEMVVRDPWPDNPNLRTYSEAEVRGTFTVIKVSVG